MSESKTQLLDEIQKIYNDVSEWLKFLEAKHAGLFAVWTALLIAVITADAYEQMKTCLQIVIVVPILIGSAINLMSFVPFLNRCNWLRKKCYKKYNKVTNNIVFYCSIFVNTYSEKKDINHSVRKYSEILKEYFGRKPNGKLEIDYIKQVIEVSTVATIKAYLFSLATTYTFTVLVCTIILMVIA